MKQAICTIDKKTWDSEEFQALSELDRSTLNKNLICPQCYEPAWFRKASQPAAMKPSPAQFCSHHKIDCGLKVQYIAIKGDGDDDGLNGSRQSEDSIIVSLHQEKATNTLQSTAPPAAGNNTGTDIRHVTKVGNFADKAQQKTLKGLLYKFVHHPEFENSDSNLTIYKDENNSLIQGKIKNINHRLENIQPAQHEVQALYWGLIVDTGITTDGNLWLNSSGDRSQSSIVVFNDIKQSFLDRFNISDLDELNGAHVLVVGKGHLARSAKPIVWCSDPSQIVLRRYQP